MVRLIISDAYLGLVETAGEAADGMATNPNNWERRMRKIRLHRFAASLSRTGATNRRVRRLERQRWTIQL